MEDHYAVVIAPGDCPDCRQPTEVCLCWMLLGEHNELLEEAVSKCLFCWRKQLPATFIYQALRRASEQLNRAMSFAPWNEVHT